MTQRRVRQVRRVRRDRQEPRRAVVRTGPAAAVLLVVATAGTAFTASISGLPAVSVDYQTTPWPSYTAGTVTPAGPPPTTATFTVSPAAGQVRARTQNSNWADCTKGSGTSWTCPVQSSEGFQWFATP